MKIDILEFAEGARKARGLTVIIDVFRAFSVECYAIDSGALKIIATGSVEEAFRLGKNYRNSVLVGERNERKIEGFDLGNSPTEILQADLKDKVVIHSTTAGTNGLINAVNSDIVLAGSLVNASSIARYIKAMNPGTVSLVGMGYRATESADEDILCAEYIKAKIEDRDVDFTQRISHLMQTSGKRFFLPENAGFSPPSDFFLCTIPDRFNFVLKATKRFDGNIDMEKIEV
ncbi:MAG TPA: 2-phosphosulfolactate phosphatase [Bacteroidales bacterium]|jgi:2-phosphosulfolactate phosphatase|nr:2-phosphosulfolactate phosphatase [Bacteroidales bacterium]